MFSAMKPCFLFLVTLLFLVPGASAQDAPLERLDTWGRNRGWEGVGLLDIAGKATCTGVMIRPDLVLTAAHCLYDDTKKRAIDPKTVQFRAGWRDGRAIAKRQGQASVIHEKYASSRDMSVEQIRNDVALLLLSDPILPTHADPFQTGGNVRAGAEVSVVSYGKGRNDAPSRQRVCDVMDAEKGLLMMTCDVVPGSSGAPVFSQRDGRPRVVAIVSAVATVEGRQVSYSMDIARPLSDVMADLRAGRTSPRKAAPAARRIMVGNGAKTGIGARFLRP